LGLGIVIGSLVVLFIGILIIGFSYWAGVSTGSEPYKDLECSKHIFKYNTSPELAEKCSAAKGGMAIGIWSFIVGLIFVIVGVITSIIFGIKLAVDNRHKKKGEIK
jgi:hypothetical protein